jgi:GNAT superfamily N-acetyltransferase
VSFDPNGRASGHFYLESCEFKDVLPFWENELWPARKSPIEPCSAMQWLGGIDMTLMKSPPTFWRVVSTRTRCATSALGTNTVGTLSGHFGGVIDGKRSYRTRGLWVSDAERRCGIGRLLMCSAFAQAKAENCEVVWTFPRSSAMPFYKSSGFLQFGARVGANDPGTGEFGPNCYALATLEETTIGDY